MAGLADLSIVVPLAPGDPAWAGLLDELAGLHECEILFAGPEEPSGFAQAARSCGARWVRSERGRARQLNEGARSSSRTALWFVHADTRFTARTLPRLREELRSAPRGVLYFDLLFYEAPPLMWINTAGARFRSRILRAPFGDQAFVMSREIFERLGGFPEDAPYGEDHLLIWKAHQRAIPVIALGAPVRTSARKYSERGWGRVTWDHGRLFAKQAWPELLKLWGAR